jgi:hypothetical protein
VNCIIGFSRLFKTVIKNKLKLRNENLRVFKILIETYNKIAITWVRKCISKPMQTALGINHKMEIIEKPISLDYKESWILENEAKKRKLLLKVIIKGILTSIL